MRAASSAIFCGAGYAIGQPALPAAMQRRPKLAALGNELNRFLEFVVRERFGEIGIGARTP